MCKVNHTPGPWRVRERESRHKGLKRCITAKRFGDISIATWNSIDRFGSCQMRKAIAEGEANAKLIAAAPDLLAVCLEIQEHETDDWAARMLTLNAAIASAT